jgi:hypothetical protein
MVSCNLRTPCLKMASSNKIQGSNPTPVVHSKPFVQVFNVQCLRLVCVDGKENVNPEN